MMKGIYANQSYPYFNIKDINKYEKKVLTNNGYSDSNRGIYNRYISKEHYLYLWEKGLFINNLSNFYFYLTFLIRNQTLTPNDNFIIKISKDVDNISPKAIKEYWKWVHYVLNYIYNLINRNNFHSMKDLYKFFTKQYTYDFPLSKVRTEDHKDFNLERLIKEKKWVCEHFALMLSLITSLYWLPSWYISINYRKWYNYTWHAISLINWNIYDPTWDIPHGTSKWMWNTFVNNTKRASRVKYIWIEYPSIWLNYINKNNKIFSNTIKYNQY